MIKLLIFGDIYGRVWRNALIKNISGFKKEFSPDFILANIDNISSWRGAIEKHVRELEAIWIDGFSSWDHIFDNEEKITPYLQSKESKIILPANLYPNEKKPYLSKGYSILEKDGKRILFIHLLGQVFIRYEVYNPFQRLKEILEETKDKSFDAVIVDFHRETTAEIAGMYQLFFSEIQLVYGTHTHVQTNDAMIGKWWTGFITDVWMTGPFDSVIWALPESVRDRFLSWIQKWKIEQQTDKQYIIHALYVEFENKNCIKIETIKRRWTL
jgi:2',3'-cyclic-nucleotide 2'-phosphodiesterase